MRITLRNCVVLALALATFVQVDPVSFVTGRSVSSEALAVVRRPVARRGAAGVVRRTTRRTIRRTNVYVRTLPAGCAKVTVNGTIVWHCGATYYQRTGSQYVVVHVN